MKRTLIWLAGGVLLGGIIHLIVILTLPALAENTVWTRIESLDARNKIVLLPQVKPGQPNPLGLDPGLSYGVCQLDLSDGPAYLNGTLPDAFWSIAIYDRNGTIEYSTTNRDGIGRTLQMGIFNSSQTRLLAEQRIDIAEGLLIIEASANDLFVVVRLAPPHRAVRPRYERALSAISCGPKQ
ncbi:hypothetical protein PSQ90_02800 [Devosia rhodophyticola]|uniref:DUF1254 domain-containing protein n=1 Tax=Devosia rhodophyticola TaxID=3026423 RepID=A0ABY7YZH1_9HYPH|nr:hypothetical protein [Devosia rhodophyticola]WDR06415.1 hypothetical protein PSQ90_02800 [Devosia rhodophyticola]